MKSRPIYPRRYKDWLKIFNKDEPFSIPIKDFKEREKAIRMAAEAMGFKITEQGTSCVRCERAKPAP